MLRTLLAVLALMTATPALALADETGLLKGTLDGADYMISKPDSWNGGLVLFAHGYEGEREGRGSLGESRLALMYARQLRLGGLGLSLEGLPSGLVPGRHDRASPALHRHVRPAALGHPLRRIDGRTCCRSPASSSTPTCSRAA